MLRSLQLPEDGESAAVIDEIDIDGFCMPQQPDPQASASFDGWFKRLVTTFDENWEDFKSGFKKSDDVGEDESPEEASIAPSSARPQPDDQERRLRRRSPPTDS